MFGQTDHFFYETLDHISFLNYTFYFFLIEGNMSSLSEVGKREKRNFFLNLTLNPP